MTLLSESYIEQAAASGKEIQVIIDQIGPILERYPQHHVVIASLAVTFMAMNPSISIDDIQEGVKGASEWIVLFLEGKGMGAVPKGMLN